MPQALASRSLIQTFSVFSSAASRLDSMIQGRLEASTRPLRTGPAMPKVAMSALWPAASTNLATISSRPRDFAAGKDGCRDKAESAICDVEECQPAVRASDVAGQNHLSKFLQWRPSRSSRSSASFGPQVPAA